MKKQFGKKHVVIILLIVMLLIGYGYMENNWVEVEQLEVKIKNLPKELQGLRIAHISDVHIPRNASTLENIITTVKVEQPDLIVMTGDIIDKRSSLDNPLLSLFCQGLSSITTTYAVSGNHEARFKNASKWEQILQQNGVKVVENGIQIISKGEATLAILGLKDNQSFAEEIFNDLAAVEPMPKILLAHRPELFYTYSSDSYNVRPDLVFSGHAHGGQFRIPVVKQGLIAPNQGLFPKFTSGLYTAENGVQMVVSRGLGNSIFPFRLNNRPHLPIITLK